MLKFFNATLKFVPIRTAQSPLYHLAEMRLESHEKKTIYATNRNIVKIILNICTYTLTVYKWCTVCEIGVDEKTQKDHEIKSIPPLGFKRNNNALYCTVHNRR